MIVAMKKVTLLTLKSDSGSALCALRDLGVMQVTPAEAVSDDSGELRNRLAKLARTAAELRAFALEHKITIAPAGNDGGKLAARADALLAEKSELLNAEAELLRRQEELACWGDFDGKLLEKLQASGVRFLLCLGTPEEFEAAKALENDGCFEVSRSKNRIAFAVVFCNTLPDASLYPVIRRRVDEDPRAIAAGVDANRQAQQRNLQQLCDIASQTSSVDAAVEDIREQLEFSLVRDALAEHGEISVLNGFVPAPEMEKIRTAAAKFGWGFAASDPDEEDEVPVLLKENKFTRLIKPLFDFLGIVPGYREIDISGGVLVFFTIFYAIIIGDAGYGVIFAASAAAGLYAAKKVPALLMPMRLLLILSVATIIWGALCGSWFGMAAIPGTDKPFPALECVRDFATNSAKQANIQFFCFILAVVQLSAGRIWRVVRERNWRAAGQHLGWMLIIWGNFFLTIRLIVYPGEFPGFMYALYGVGLVMVMCCGVNWKQASDIFQFPFDIIGSFTDVLSYIRLFAVGLAGACIAGSFNGMAFDLCQVSKWLLPAGALVVIAGHALNIALALLGVLVHAVRLNTLEFSNHTGLSWSGQSFNPFKSHKTKE